MAEPSMRSAWIRRFHPAPEAPVRLVCFPHAGGAATYYHSLSQAMSPDADVLAIQYPGRQDRLGEPCIEDIPTLADRLVDELVPWSDRPLVLLGHSMGAAVAFEVALRLERRGVVPLGLFASGRRAPSLRRDQRVHLATDAELVAELKKLNAANAEVFADETLLRMVLPTIRSDYRAIERYHNPSALPLRCPIVALTGDADPVADVADVELWARHTSASFRMRVFRGGHFFLDDHADAVRQEIRDHIAAVSTC
ncbi:thioesterase II family protein [Sphaerisporangium sp. NPDC049003]|uniref:thioesterase II family protein n=1 Tax=Sphaerisporangium sp. NPDC049003 TaxID=3364517 RepID=UPI003711BD12